MSKRPVVLPLLVLGIILSSRGQDPPTTSHAIFEAVKRGDLEKVVTLLEKGVDVNCRGEHQYTPLIAAARYKRLDIAQALCERGADVNAAADVDWGEEEWGYTPLIWAASNCNIGMAELLINKGAAVGHKGRGGDMPLVIAARRGCLPLVKILISKGAAVDAEDWESSDTALMVAVSGGHLDLAEYLIEKGADTRRKSLRIKSLLMLAASSGHFAGVRYFHEKGFAVNEPDNYGQTAMHYAANDRVESRYILEYLIQHGGNTSGKDSFGTSPLMIASANGASKAAKILIMNGAAVQEADRQGRTPLHHACRGIRDNSSENVAKWETTILLLLDKEAQVNARDIEGNTPLMNAVRNDAPRIVELLLKHGAQVNTQDKKGWTALMHAAGGNQTAVIKVLAERGADLDMRNAKGETALAVAKKRPATAQAYELLKSLGAKD